MKPLMFMHRANQGVCMEVITEMQNGTEDNLKVKHDILFPEQVYCMMDCIRLYCFQCLPPLYQPRI